MESKPGDFFIGIIDFFSVLLPGALITFFIDVYLHDHIFGPGNIIPYDPDEISRVFIFLFCSYVLGHFIFAVGSKLDELYDTFFRKGRTKNYDIAFCAASLAMDKYVQPQQKKREIVSSLRFVSRFSGADGVLGKYKGGKIKKLEKEIAKIKSPDLRIALQFAHLQLAMRSIRAFDDKYRSEIKESVDLIRLNKYLTSAGNYIEQKSASNKDEQRKQKQLEKDGLEARSWQEIREMFVEDKSIGIFNNTYKGILAILHLEESKALDRVTLMEANQKFFRSMCVAFALISFVILLTMPFQYFTSGSVSLTRVYLTLGSFALAYGSLVRFSDLRYKCTEFAYEVFIAREVFKQP